MDETLRETALQAVYFAAALKEFTLRAAYFAEVLRQNAVLFIFLAAAARMDFKERSIPMWLIAFGFFGRIFCGGEDFLKDTAFAAAAALSVYFIARAVGRILKKEALGRGDIYIIFIMGLFLPPETLLCAVFLSCVFALVMAVMCLAAGCADEMPLAGAFLFGTMAAVW